jgi:hypothetical protein
MRGPPPRHAIPPSAGVAPPKSTAPGREHQFKATAPGRLEMVPLTISCSPHRARRNVRFGQWSTDAKYRACGESVRARPWPGRRRRRPRRLYSRSRSERQDQKGSRAAHGVRMRPPRGGRAERRLGIHVCAFLCRRARPGRAVADSSYSPTELNKRWHVHRHEPRGSCKRTYHRHDCGLAPV